MVPDLLSDQSTTSINLLTFPCRLLGVEAADFDDRLPVGGDSGAIVKAIASLKRRSSQRQPITLAGQLEATSSEWHSVNHIQ